MYEKFIEAVKQWAEENGKIESVIIVGSYARGTNTVTSDLDLVILTPCRMRWWKIRNLQNYLGRLRSARRSIMEPVPLCVCGIKTGWRLNSGL